MTIESLDVLKAEQDIQDRTRMLDTLGQLNHIISLFDEMSVGMAMVWLWTWDTIKNYYSDVDLVLKDEETVFSALWHAVRDGNGFSLEYGAEQHQEEVRDWMFERDLMKYVDEPWEDEDEEDGSFQMGGAVVDGQDED